MQEVPPLAADFLPASPNFPALLLIPSPSFEAVNLLISLSTTFDVISSSRETQSFTTTPTLNTFVTNILFFG
ncbi:hypothetical protein SOVF_072170 [Spinacia oleracea]|nr:hypothetical protein SOVF_072170 [Spinacia oleracea]